MSKSKYLGIAVLALLGLNFVWVPFYQSGGEPYRWAKTAVIREMRWKNFENFEVTKSPADFIWAAKAFFAPFEFSDLRPGTEPDSVRGLVATFASDTSRTSFSYDRNRVVFGAPSSPKSSGTPFNPFKTPAQAVTPKLEVLSPLGTPQSNEGALPPGGSSAPRNSFNQNSNGAPLDLRDVDLSKLNLPKP